MKNNSNISPTNELQSFKSAFIIPYSYNCVNTIDNILVVNDTYHLVDFGSKPNEIQLTIVIFLNAFLRDNNKLELVLLDIKQDKLLTRTDNGGICDWIIMETDVFNSAPESGRIK